MLTVECYVVSCLLVYLQHGFKGGLVIGIEDFDLSSLDPLK